MSFTKLRDDTCAYKHQLTESVGPGEYMIDRNNRCNPCFVPSPTIRLGSYGAALCHKELIDVDSELMGLTRKASDCPSKQYLPSDKPYCRAVPLKECNSLDEEATRISNPPCTLRCRGWNRWEWLCQNPQERVEVPFDWNINNRLVVKDNHRPCLPKPIDQTLALPPHTQQVKEQFCGIVQEPHPLNWRPCKEISQY